jgi:glycyl-tRNA synthetase beta subunit
MRVFGHFEQPIFLEIVKHIEYVTVPTNQYLFRVSKQQLRFRPAFVASDVINH